MNALSWTQRSFHEDHEYSITALTCPIAGTKYCCAISIVDEREFQKVCERENPPAKLAATSGREAFLLTPRTARSCIRDVELNLNDPITQLPCMTPCSAAASRDPVHLAAAKPSRVSGCRAASAKLQREESLFQLLYERF